MTIFDLVLAIMALPALLAALYLLTLALAARVPRTPVDDAEPSLRFDVVVPAHDEEIGVGATVRNILSSDYPEHLRRVLVVADNCSDATSRAAMEAGAIVLERHDLDRVGKGYALAMAFDQVEDDDWADAVVVVDADTVVSAGLLRAFARRIEDGAEVVQAEYGVRNAETSWRTRLMVIALAIFHVLRSLGRERLGLSVGLRGNGMAFTREVLRRVPFEAFSIVEDVEYALMLGENGVRVCFAHDAWVAGEMVSQGVAARAQRLRWERGRASLARARAPGLLAAALVQRDPILLDLAIDLLIPPLSSIFVATSLATAVVSARSLAEPSSTVSMIALVAWWVSMISLVVYVMRGWALSGVGLRGLTALAHAPRYLAWKIGLVLRGRTRADRRWVRTTREDS